MSTCAIRPAVPGDLPMITNGWRDSFYAAHAAGPYPKDVYREAMRETVARLLMKPDTQVLTAHSAAGPEPLYGFIAWRTGLLYHLYVKQPYRKRGYASALMDAAGFPRTARFGFVFKTPASQELVKRWFGARWEPLALRGLTREPTP